MPRSNIPKVFRKRRNIGQPKERTGNENELSPRPITTDQAQTPTDNTRSASHIKLTPNLDKYDSYSISDCTNIIISSEILKKIVSEVAVCRDCGSDLSLSLGKNVGLAAEIMFECEGCDRRKKYYTSSKVSLVQEHGKKYVAYDVNLRYVYGMRCIGKGQTGGMILAGIMNLPTPPTRYIKYNKLIGKYVKDVCLQSMTSALDEAVKKNDDSRDICIALDGSWQKRGHTSLNGVISATSFDTGKVIDVSIKSKFCRCKQKDEGLHLDSCTANYQGVSGGMEIDGVMEIFQRSIEKDVRYAYYLGDGDSKAFKNVEDAKIYGQDFEIKKLECIGHVQKRMGTRLKTLKQKSKGKKLADEKSMSGKGRLTDGAILKIQNYYGVAIRRNTSNLEAMKREVWAEYFHLCSSNENPQHGLCPKGDTSWCKYQKAMAAGLNYNHTEHFHLPDIIMREIKSIFRDLAKPDLLRKCLHGKTQNPNESLNNVIWSRLPKINFVGLNTLCLGVYDAVASFNEGNIAKCQVLKSLGMEPGLNCVSAMKDLDKARIRKGDRESAEIQKKARQSKRLMKRRLEEDMEDNDCASGPSYGAGMY